jgi:hypothetical protein
MSKGAWKLTKDQKVDVVVRLACYDSPSAIVKSLKEDFGIEIARQAIERYNPLLRYGGRRCSEQWATLFYETRRKLVEGMADIGAAHKMVRIRWLDQMVRREMTGGHTAEARALLKQVAEEMGEGVTHRHDHHGVILHGDLSEADLYARLRATFERLTALLAARSMVEGSAGGGGGSGALAGPGGATGGHEQAQDALPGDRPAPA